MNTHNQHNTDGKAMAKASDSTGHPPQGALSPAPSPARSLLRRVAKGLGALSAVSLSALLGPLVLVAALWGLWVWTGTPGSLGTALNLIHWALPSGQQLRSADVQGNLQQGGRIGQISWQSGGLQVQAQDTLLVLDWSQLWRQAWPVQSIRMQSLRVRDQRPPKPVTPMTELRLPLALQLALQVDQLVWQGSTAVSLSDVRAQYAFDGQEHRLDVDSLALAQGRYTVQARLQGAAPMALHVSAQGQVQTPASGRTPALQLQVLSTVQGQLSGPQAQLSVQAELSPTPGQGALGRAPDKVQLLLQAQIQPWQAQAVVQAEGQWQALDLAPLWPGAPQTRLQGQARLLPDGAAWQLDAQVNNQLPGAWDLKRLPLTQLNLKARHAQGLWQIQQAQARLTAGQLQGQGQQTPKGWNGQLEIRNLPPALLHSAWAGPAVQGILKAEDTGNGTIALSADLQAPKAQATNAANPAALQWEQLQLTGQWHPERWDIDSLRLQAARAVLEAQFKWQPTQKAVQGRMTLALPGMQASAQGNLAPTSGQGRLEVQMQDAASSQTWLQGLPGWGTQFKTFKASGPAQLQAQWQGGFDQIDAPLSLNLQWPRIESVQPSPKGAPTSPPIHRSATWFLAPGQLKLQGTPLAVQAELQARLGQGSHSAQLQSTWNAKRSDVHSANWQGRIEQLAISTPNTQTPSAAPWQLALQSSLTWQAQLDQMAFTWGPSNWLLQGPSPGRPRIQAEAGGWTAPSAGQALQTHGALNWSDLPASWAQNWLGTDLLNDITLQGQAQWRLDQELNLSVTAERSQGDLRIQTDSPSGQRTAAGLRQAKVHVQVQNEKLIADLNWDSAQMGQAKAQLQSQLKRTSDGWQWAEQAPLSGHVQANLPQIGAWSVLAPPGWRVQGTLEANLTLSGTRNQPQWQGRLQADQLAARSAVQGIEFSQGQMQARLQGQRLVLERLSLRGAGAQGGELQGQGLVQFNTKSPASSGTNPLLTADLDLQINARNLRVSNRADRRLSVSGDLTARMSQGQMQLRGGVKADQALFVLPDNRTPSLGDDVVVFRPGMGELNLNALTSPTDPNAPSSSWLGVPDVRVMLDLGSDFQLQGQGLNTRLNGQVELISNASTRGQPRLSGQVRTEGGRYKAYGQQLNIDTGVLRFSGPYDNPSLDIIALRPNLPQKVGVQITGTALLPRIRLYADPDLPDADKLAWLVLGRSAANGGAESAVLQQAAVALISGNGKILSGELANSLGLDEISLASGSRSDATATGAAVTLGKRLSKDFYLAYETSLSGAFGSLYIFYDLSRRLTLRAQAGEQSALDLIFTVRRD
ncbi:MAG: translocation/assembly module TamB domain-containing protein [Limnohabitans sp.]|nr:translocation/assembly module TamB domain-containing protein [Limnohabitans sp.]